MSFFQCYRVAPSVGANQRRAAVEYPSCLQSYSRGRIGAGQWIIAIKDPIYRAGRQVFWNQGHTGPTCLGPEEKIIPGERAGKSKALAGQNIDLPTPLINQGSQEAIWLIRSWIMYNAAGEKKIPSSSSRVPSFSIFFPYFCPTFGSHSPIL